jgi:formylglycine-generating enzyme required for sulfatase activity
MRSTLVCAIVFILFFAAYRSPNLKASTEFRAGQVFRDCPDCPEMVVIPAGGFLMGSPAKEPGRDAIEGPQHRVKIAQFAAGKFDITQGQWKVFVADTKRKVVSGCAWAPSDQDLNPNFSWEKLGFQQDDNHPVVCVAWSDVQDYVRWVSEKTGKKYRLLSEAEWEYAARAGSTEAYPWGNAVTRKQANYGAEECCSPLAKDEDKWEETSPVGSFPPNKFGLYGMNGNVLQWVQDCFSDSYANVPVNGAANERSIKLKTTGDLASMAGSDSCSYRMVRGGDWGDPPSMLRSAFRNYAPGPGATLENYRSGGLGFRVARTLD